MRKNLLLRIAPFLLSASLLLSGCAADEQQHAQFLNEAAQYSLTLPNVTGVGAEYSTNKSVKVTVSVEHDYQIDYYLIQTVFFTFFTYADEAVKLAPTVEAVFMTNTLRPITLPEERFELLTSEFQQLGFPAQLEITEREVKVSLLSGDITEYFRQTPPLTEWTDTNKIGEARTYPERYLVSIKEATSSILGFDATWSVAELGGLGSVQPHQNYMLKTRVEFATTGDAVEALAGGKLQRFFSTVCTTAPDKSVGYIVEVDVRTPAGGGLNTLRGAIADGMVAGDTFREWTFVSTDRPDFQVISCGEQF